MDKKIHHSVDEIVKYITYHQRAEGLLPDCAEYRQGYLDALEIVSAFIHCPTYNGECFVCNEPCFNREHPEDVSAPGECSICLDCQKFFAEVSDER